jgi:hypothetical protein
MEIPYSFLILKKSYTVYQWQELAKGIVLPKSEVKQFQNRK